VRTAVVGHVEWGEFAVVDRVPAAGEIVHARSSWRAAGGGGAVAAVQLARLGESAFLTTLGADPDGDAAEADLRSAGVELHAARRAATRRVLTFLDAAHERTITVLGERLVPHGADPLPWDLLAGCDAVYFTGGDGEALRRARGARWLVATPRALDVLRTTRVALDVLVGSASDEGERVPAGALDPAPRFVVRTQGPLGGEWAAADGSGGRWAAAALPGDPVDAYGCGDAFAAGLTHGLAATGDLAAALDLAARCGAHALCGRGPHGGLLASDRAGG